MDKKQGIKISIVVPAYNAEKYLSICLDSLLTQDLEQDEYEVIIVNDGSTDKTESILQGYSEKYQCISYISTENAGVSEARNTGCERARGEYLLFVDADDFLEKDVLHTIYETMEKDTLDILIMDYHYWDRGTFLKKEFEYKSSGEEDVCTGREFMLRFIPYAVWLGAYRLSYWRAHHFRFLPIRHEDEEITPRLLYFAERVIFIPLEFYYYTRNGDSYMSNYNPDGCFYMLKAMSSLSCFVQHDVTDEQTRRFLTEYIGRRLFSNFKRSIRMNYHIEEKLILAMKECYLSPVNFKSPLSFNRLLYSYFPHTFIAYHKTKVKLKNLFRSSRGKDCYQGNHM